MGLLSLTPIQGKLVAAAAGILVFVAYTAFVYHKGAVNAVAPYKVAVAVAQQKQKDAETALQVQATQSHKDAQNAQAKLDDALTPIPVVRVCRIPSGGIGLSAAGAAIGGTQDSAAVPGVVSAVPTGAVGPDISGGLAILVSAAAELAIVDAERDSRLSK